MLFNGRVKPISCYVRQQCEGFVEFDIKLGCTPFDICSLRGAQFQQIFIDGANADNYWNGVLSNYVGFGVFRCVGSHRVGDADVVWEDVTGAAYHRDGRELELCDFLERKSDCGEMDFMYPPKSNELLVTKLRAVDSDYSYWRRAMSASPYKFDNGCDIRYAVNFGRYYSAADWDSPFALKTDSYNEFVTLRSSSSFDKINRSNYPNDNISDDNSILLKYHFPNDNEEGYTYFIETVHYAFTISHAQYAYVRTVDSLYIDKWSAVPVEFGSAYGNVCTVESVSPSGTFSTTFDSFAEANKYALGLSANGDFVTQDIRIKFDLRQTNNGLSIRPSSTGSGTISPDRRCVLPVGSTQEFTLAPSEDAGLQSLLVDGVDCAQSIHNNKYIFENLSSNHTINAVFESPAPTYNVSVDVTPRTSGDVTGAGDYPRYTPVTLRATPRDGYYFLWWGRGGEILSPDARYSFDLTEDMADMSALFGSMDNLESIYKKVSVSANNWSMGEVQIAGALRATIATDKTFFGYPLEITPIPNGDCVFGYMDIDGSAVVCSSYNTAPLGYMTAHSVLVNFFEKADISNKYDCYIGAIDSDGAFADNEFCGEVVLVDHGTSHYEGGYMSDDVKIKVKDSFSLVRVEEVVYDRGGNAICTRDVTSALTKLSERTYELAGVDNSMQKELYVICM